VIIENHSDIFHVDKRLRGIGNIRMPGDGFTYAQLKGAAIGVILSTPIAALGAFILPAIAPTVIFLPGSVVGWILILGIVAIAAVTGAHRFSSLDSDGLTVTSRAWNNLRARTRSNQIAAGEYVRTTSHIVRVATVVSARP